MKLSGSGQNSARGRAVRGVLILVVLAALSGTGATSIAGQTTASTPEAREFTATMELSPARAQLGDSIAVTGSGYPADSDIELVWYTAVGHYEIEERAIFVGQKLEPTSEVLQTVRSDASGAIASTFEVPVGFGGPHDVRGRVNGEEISQAGLMIEPRLSMTPNEGPVGTPVELRVEGIDIRASLNTWHILYDNGYLGFMSAVTTNGIAVAHFRAAGPVGVHLVQLYTNVFQSSPYLAWDTSPLKDEFEMGIVFPFNVTSDPGVIEPQIDDFADRDDPWPVASTGSGKLSLSRDRGTVGEVTTITGSGLPADTDVQLLWGTMIGNRVTAIGFSEESWDLGIVRTDADGSFVTEFAIPDDLGGHHRIDAVVGDKVVAVTALSVQPSLVSISPATVRAGESFEIHLKGVGWTEYDNTYTITYDNSYIGYVCGFSTNGDVRFTVVATGEPGTHIVDLYPTVYRGKEPRPVIFSVPQLTYAEDHPGRPLPAIRLSIEIVK